MNRHVAAYWLHRGRVPMRSTARHHHTKFHWDAAHSVLVRPVWLDHRPTIPTAVSPAVELNSTKIKWLPECWIDWDGNLCNATGEVVFRA